MEQARQLIRPADLVRYNNRRDGSQVFIGANTREGSDFFRVGGKRTGIPRAACGSAPLHGG